MFGKSHNGAATMQKPDSPQSRGASESFSGVVQRVWSGAPNRNEVRAWMVAHPLLSVGAGVAAGCLAISLIGKARRAARPAPSAPPHPLGDSRVFGHATSALWLIPLVELARVGLQAATLAAMASTRRPAEPTDSQTGR